MSSKTWNWINDRIPLDKILQLGLDEEIPGGASFFFTLGSATLFVFILQMVTGIWQLFYYVPTVDHAYDSLNYLRLFVPYGWLAHGLHYWGATAMVVLVGLHILRVFIWGAYKKPREMTWLIGVVLLLLTVAMSFTGAALPWDERGYWAAEVGTSIAGTVPFIGNWLKFLFLGGFKMGQLTLSRFFVLHTAIIPGVSLLFIVLHIIAFRKFGSVGPWKESKRKVKGYFWPEQIGKDVIVSALIFILLVTLSAFNSSPFMGPADPLDSTFTPKPEWNFLFLYQALKLFPGALELIGTVGIPTFIILLFASLPFIDRKSSRSPFERPGVMFGGFVFSALVLMLTVIGFQNTIKKNSLQVKLVSANKSIKLSASALNGKHVFDKYGCVACHTMSGKGGTIGPNLTNEIVRGRSKSWIIVQLTNSKKHNLKSIMPPFTMLSNKELSDLADYLLSPHKAGKKLPINPNTTVPIVLPIKETKNNVQSILDSSQSSINKNKNEHKMTSTGNNKAPGEAAGTIGNVAHGSLLFQQYCESCHGINGMGGVHNPGSLTKEVPALNPISKKLFNKNPQDFANNIDIFIQHGSVPAGKTPALHMFSYGDSHTLTQQEIANIEAYILNINDVNRAESPGASASIEQYFTVILSTFIFIGLILIFIYVLQLKKVKS